VTSAGDLAEEVVLRAYDAVQLAATVSLDFVDLVFVTADRQLAAAAHRSGWLPSPTRGLRHKPG